MQWKNISLGRKIMTGMRVVLVLLAVSWQGGRSRASVPLSGPADARW